MDQNILFIIDRLETGGTQRVVLNLAKYLPEKGFKVYVLCLYSYANHIVKEFKDSGVEVYFMDLADLLTGLVFWKIKRMVKKLNIDIVQTFLFWSNWIGGVSCRMACMENVVYSIRCVNTDYPFWKFMIERWASGLARKIIINSQSIQDFAIKNEGVKKEQLVLIYNGIDYEKFTDTNSLQEPRLKKEFKLPDKSFVISCIARICPQKGQAYLLEAFKEIYAANKDAILLFAGSGEDESKLQKLALASGYGQSIFFLGNRTDIADILSATSIFVLPSLFEGMPNGVMEAMAAGKPVVASDIDGIKELVVDGITGFLVNKKDPAQIAEKVIYLMKNRDILIRIGEAGRNRIKDSFSLAKMIEDYAGFYHSLLN